MRQSDGRRLPPCGRSFLIILVKVKTFLARNTFQRAKEHGRLPSVLAPLFHNHEEAYKASPNDLIDNLINMDIPDKVNTCSGQSEQFVHIDVDRM